MSYDVEKNSFEDMDFWNEEPLAELAASRKPRTKSAENGEGILTVDVYETEDDIVIKSTIAGVTDQNLDVSVTSDMVTIRGHRKPEEKMTITDYHHQELYWGPFYRTIILPEDVDPDGTKANLKNGVLTLKLPKLSRLKTKKIRITT